MTDQQLAHENEFGARPPDQPQNDIVADTRTLSRPPVGASLEQVKQIYIDVSGDESLREPVRQALSVSIRSEAQLSVMQKLQQPDAVLKVSVRGETAGSAGTEAQAVIVVRLVNAGGYVIWPGPAGGSGGKYVGSITEVTGRIARDLSEQIQQARKH